MPIETEIKLKVTPQVLTRVRSHALIRQSQQETWQEKKLFNIYYDTPDFALTQEKIALRTRKTGEQFIQTLKTQGTSVAGLSQRNEWEWPLSSEDLDTTQLTSDIWPSTLAESVKNQLVPIFRTDFVRQQTLVQWQHNGVQSVIEVALDEGTIATEDKSESICEVELELKQGQAGALFDLAVQIAQDLPVLTSEISKAERGYRLLMQRQAEKIIPITMIPLELNITERIRRLEQILQRSQRYAEDFLQYAQHDLFVAWLASLGQMQQLLAPVNAQLAATLHIIQSSWAQQAPQSVHTYFITWLTKRQWGMFSLLCAQWMFLQSSKTGH